MIESLFLLIAIIAGFVAVTELVSRAAARREKRGGK